MNIYQIIKRPVITEKAGTVREGVSQYAFEVDPYSTKVDIKHAIENMFKVHVTDVRTITMHGKPKKNPRTGRSITRADWKKAMVTLKKGDKIEIFEGT